MAKACASERGYGSQWKIVSTLLWHGDTLVSENTFAGYGGKKLTFYETYFFAGDTLVDMEFRDAKRSVPHRRGTFLRKMRPAHQRRMAFGRTVGSPRLTALRYPRDRSSGGYDVR